MSFLTRLFGNKHPEPPSLPKSRTPVVKITSAGKVVRPAVGPSPWAWRDRSHVLRGQQYRFREFTSEEKLSGLIKIVDPRDRVLLILDFQCYARFMDDGLVLLWWETTAQTTKSIAFCSFRFDQLAAIENPSQAAAEMRAQKNRTSSLNGIEVVTYPCLFDAGEHNIDAPAQWSVFEETLVLADYAAGGNSFDKMCRAIFVFDWKNRKVTVLPQDWFNNGDYDFGYQWIARVARTESGIIVGEGIRLGAFELDETGRQVKLWLSPNTFHMI